MNKKIRVGLIGIGNCVSSLVQGVAYYSNNYNKKMLGILFEEIGGYKITDIEFCLAYDIDQRKVNKNLGEAIFAEPNCTLKFYENVQYNNIKVKMGVVLDSVAPHMAGSNKSQFLISKNIQPTKEQIIRDIKEANIDMLVNYLPVGSQKATEFYAECALEAGIGFINNIPVFIASDSKWVKKFQEKKIPILGDDVKSQFGATVVHRVLSTLLNNRGVIIDKSYQLNFGGNSDFNNMLDKSRLLSKKISKTESVQHCAMITDKENNLHIGPSDYVPWLNDNKICFIKIDGRGFGDVPISLELKLSVEDSPNSAGVVVDAIRCCKLAIDRGLYGAIEVPSAYYYKTPPRNYDDFECFEELQNFIKN